MRSSAGLNSPQFRTSIVLAAVALAALAVSLLLAFASATAPRSGAIDDGTHRTTAETRSGSQAQETAPQTPVAAPVPRWPGPSTTAGAVQPQLLRALLAPWVFALDAIAVLGLVAVLIVRYNARRRRGAPR